MQLIGQYDSPFVRRVGIGLHLYGIGYEHVPWSVFADAALVRAVNPLGRVPVLVLDDGVALIETSAILDLLDEGAGEAALTPRAGVARREALRRMALATGLAEKAVALVYEARFHEPASAAWVGRVEGQIGAVLTVLEGEVGRGAHPFWHGAAPGHADVALACAVRFLGNAHPHLAVPAGIAAHAARCEALAVFQAVGKPFQR